MKYIYLFLFSSLLLWGCKDAADKAALNQVVDQYQAFHDTLSLLNKDSWNFETDSVIKAKNNFYEVMITTLNGLDTTSFTEEELINRELLLLEMENGLSEIKFGSYMMPLNSEGGFLTGIVYNLQNINTKSKEKQDSYIKKLNSLPDYLMAQTSRMSEGMGKGITSPKVITQRCIDLVENYVNINTDDNIFTRAAEGNDSLKSEVVVLVEQKILPAYQEFLKFLKDEYLSSSMEVPGISSLQGGKEYYEAKTRYYTTLNISPEDVFNKGQEEVKRIRAEMENVIKDSGYKGDFASFLKFLRTDPQFYAKTPRELLYRATWLSKKIEGKLPQYFNALPRMPFTVEEVPADIAPNYTGGRYSEGSYQTGKPGAYWVNTYKLESRPLYVLPSLTLHEAVPGHHLQIMLSREMKDVPKFREQLYISAFGEGWGLYSEYLGKEAGMYETAYEDFGRLTYEMWRACRLVVDVGLHYKGWTRDQAVEFMASNTALSLHEVNTEIDRYIGWPAQAVSYKMGEIKIRELRKRAETELGEKFDIKSFHDLVLSKGSIKISRLETMVNAWINS